MKGGNVSLKLSFIIQKILIIQPLIVVTDPNELIVMKQKEDVLDPGHSWSKENFCEFPTLGKIQLRVIQGTDLMDTDLIGKSDPYCIVLCGPVSPFVLISGHEAFAQNKFETKRVPNDLNPKWSEKFDFDWHGEELLQIECWDFNKFTHDDFLGSVEIRLSTQYLVS